MKRALLLLVVIIPFFAQAAPKDGRVLMQAFTWESHGAPLRGRWYNYLRGRVKEIQSAGIDLLWLPPPSHGEGAGYHPQQLNLLSNNYGNEADHQALIRDLRRAGVTPIADLVLNHRKGTVHIHSSSAVSAMTSGKMYVADVGEPGGKPSLVLHLGME